MRTTIIASLISFFVILLFSASSTGDQSIESSYSHCSQGMFRITGEALDGSNDMVNILQDSTCIKWMNTEFPARCAVFSPELWDRVVNKIKRHHMDFCMDVFEWPNIEGVEPNIFIDWYSAKNECKKAGKRLCTEEEWTFACEGEEGLPYPYGFERNADACNIDHKWIAPDEGALSSQDHAEEELKRLWQGMPSGAMASCVSPFGIHDMTGNVDEWTTSTRNSGFKSILKGGYWSTVRNRCRPSTRAHFEGYRNYQQGFRCCSDIKK